MTKKTIATVVISCFLFFACSKQRKYERMVEGEKIIESYFVDGADSLTWLVDSVIRCNDYYFKFHSQNGKEDPSEIHLRGKVGCPNPGSSLIGSGLWSLTNKQETLKMTVKTYSNALIIFPEEWSILKLSSSEIWLETESGNKNYEIRFKTR